MQPNQRDLEFCSRLLRRRRWKGSIWGMTCEVAWVPMNRLSTRTLSPVSTGASWFRVRKPMAGRSRRNWRSPGRLGPPVRAGGARRRIHRQRALSAPTGREAGPGPAAARRGSPARDSAISRGIGLAPWPRFPASSALPRLWGTRKNAIPGLVQHGFRKRGFRKP
jgi:hypothetical protein